MEYTTKQIADEFIKDHGKGRLALKVLICLAYGMHSIYMGLLLISVVMGRVTGADQPTVVFGLCFGAPLGYLCIYLFYYLAKSVLLMRDRMAIAAKSEQGQQTRYFGAHEQQG